MKKNLIILIASVLFSCSSNKSDTYSLIDDFTADLGNLRISSLEKHNFQKRIVLFQTSGKQTYNHKNLSKISEENLDVWWKDEKYNDELTGENLSYLKTKYLNSAENFSLEKSKIVSADVLDYSEIIEKASKRGSIDFLVLKISEPIFNKDKTFAIFNCSYYLNYGTDENRFKDSIIIMRKSKLKWLQVGEIYINVIM